MTPAQKKLGDLKERQSKERQRMAELGMVDELTTETRAELDTIEQGTPDLERQIRAANVAMEREDTEQRTQQTAASPDPEMRERIELRSQAQLTNYLQVTPYLCRRTAPSGTGKRTLNAWRTRSGAGGGSINGPPARRPGWRPILNIVKMCLPGPGPPTSAVMLKSWPTPRRRPRCENASGCWRVRPASVTPNDTGRTLGPGGVGIIRAPSTGIPK